MQLSGRGMFNIPHCRRGLNAHKILTIDTRKGAPRAAATWQCHKGLMASVRTFPVVMHGDGSFECFPVSRTHILLAH